MGGGVNLHTITVSVAASRCSAPPPPQHGSSATLRLNGGRQSVILGLSGRHSRRSTAPQVLLLLCIGEYSRK